MPAYRLALATLLLLLPAFASGQATVVAPAVTPKAAVAVNDPVSVAIRERVDHLRYQQGGPDVNGERMVHLETYLFPLNELDQLRTTLDQRPEPVTWFQNTPLHTQEKYLGFANGAGVRALLQYMQDFFFYTNNGLTYEFQGLTQDGRHYVNVRFPVSVGFLMELDGFQLPPVNLNPQAIPVPAWPADYEQQRQVIEAYNNEALQRFAQLPDGGVSPDLALLDNLVQSIQIDQP